MADYSGGRVCYCHSLWCFKRPSLTGRSPLPAGFWALLLFPHQFVPLSGTAAAQGWSCPYSAQFWNPLFVLRELVPFSGEQCLEIKARPTCPRYRVPPFLGPWQTDFPQHHGGLRRPCPVACPFSHMPGHQDLQWQWCCAYQSATVTLSLSAVLSETEAFQGLSLFFTSWG